MKTKLLFTAALMSALSTVPSDMYAFQFRGNEFSAKDYVSVLAEDVKERPEDGTDVSEWIVNPDFNNNNGDGWENGEILGFKGNSVTPCGTAEVYGREFQISQVIENIPNGLYTITVQGWANRGGRAWLKGSTYIDNGRSEIGDGISGSLHDVSKIFNEDPEAHKVVLGDLMVVDGKIQIGLSWEGYVGGSWVAFDNFKLIYNNDGKDRISGLYNDLKNTLQTLNDSQYPEALNVYINKEAGLIDSEDNTDSYCLAYMKLKNLEVLLSSEAKDLKNLQNLCQKLINDQTGNVDLLQTALDQSNAKLSTVKTNDDIKLIYEALKKSHDEYVESIGGSYVVESFDFDDGTYNGWNNTGNKWPSPEHGVLEYYNTNFDFWRPLSGILKGWYQIEVNAFYRSTDYTSYVNKKNKTLANVFGDNGGPDKRYSMPALCLYEQDCSDVEGIKMGNEGKFPNFRNEANACFSAGKYKMVVNAYVGDNGTLNYGLAGFNQGNSWMCFDNFKVTYMGTDLSAMYEAMKSSAVELAEKYGLTAYQAEIGAMVPQDPENVTEDDIWTLNEKTKKIIDIVNKIVDVKLGNNAEANNLLTKKEELLSHSTAPQSSLDKFNKICDIENTDYIYPLVTSEEDVDHIFKNAYYDYLNEADPVGDYTFDMNHLLTNPNVRFWQKGSPATGWYCDLDRGNFQVQSNDKQQGEDEGWEFVEAWTSGVFHQKNGNGWLIYQSVDLPVGAYSLSAYTFGQDPGNNDAQSTDTPSANLSVGYGSTVLAQGKPVEKGTKKLQTFSFMVNEPLTGDKKGKLGIFINEDNDCSWFGINNMKLVKVAPTTLSLSEENTSLGIDSDTYGNVTVERSLKADGKWNTFCVPFAMTAEQLAANKITDVRKLISTEEKDGSVVLNFSDPVTEIEAGVPYIVKVSETLSQITVNGVAVKVAEPAPLEEGSVNMLGNYGKINITGYDKYFISDNKFYRAADKNIIVKGFRAYITMDQAAAGVNQMLINIDGNVTAIEDVLGEDVDATVNVYTIDGVCVKSGVKSSEALDGLRKGIYIVNGKKVVK